jgi:dihydrofolate reductase
MSLPDRAAGLPAAPSIIAAMDRNRAIGKGNRMPWHLPDDLKRFKALTRGHHVVMGRKTFDSIGRLLPGRTNVVITRQLAYTQPGAIVVHSLAEALQRCAGDPEPFVIGGAEIYQQAMAAAGRLYLTKVDTLTEGADAFFPLLDPEVWRAVAEEAHATDAAHAHAFRWVTYERSCR